MRVILFFVLALLMAAPVVAVTPDERLQDPVLEARARGLTKELRCLVCQGETIDDSAAGFARDLRILVREKIAQGQTDAEIVDFLTARYGDFILMTPPVGPKTWLLWMTPAIVFFGGLAMVGWAVRRKKA